MDSLASNLLLEAEKERLMLLVKGKKSAMHEERLSNVEFKLQMLQLQVESGALTPLSYLNLLQKAITKAKAVALRFKQAGKLAEAHEALRRAKVMEQETQEMQQFIE